MGTNFWLKKNQKDSATYIIIYTTSSGIIDQEVTKKSGDFDF